MEAKHHTFKEPTNYRRNKKTHENMLNVTYYQRNANQNHNKVPSHTSQNGCYQKVYKQMLEKREPSYTVGGNAN